MPRKRRPGAPTYSDLMAKARAYRRIAEQVGSAEAARQAEACEDAAYRLVVGKRFGTGRLDTLILTMQSGGAA